MFFLTFVMQLGVKWGARVVMGKINDKHMIKCICRNWEEKGDKEVYGSLSVS